jgi:hypothetical protein
MVRDLFMYAGLFTAGLTVGGFVSVWVVAPKPPEPKKAKVTVTVSKICTHALVEYKNDHPIITFSPCSCETEGVAQGETQIEQDKESSGVSD